MITVTGSVPPQRVAATETLSPVNEGCTPNTNNHQQQQLDGTSQHSSDNTQDDTSQQRQNKIKPDLWSTVLSKAASNVGGGRSALLDSISAFKKAGLRKSVTKDNSDPKM